MYNVVTDSEENMDSIRFSMEEESPWHVITLGEDDDGNQIIMLESDGHPDRAVLIDSTETLDHFIKALHLAKQWGWMTGEGE